MSCRPPEHQSFWLWVMCLTGVDYFSTLGYQPSIAFEAVGLLAPLATIVLIAVTLGCALPVYCARGRGIAAGARLDLDARAAAARLDGQVPGARAARLRGHRFRHHANAFRGRCGRAPDSQSVLGRRAPPILQSQMLLTIGMLVLLGAMFLRGFKEVIAIAVVIVAVYLVLNVIVLVSGMTYLAFHPGLVTDVVSTRC